MSGFGLDPNTSAVAFNDSLADCEADSGTRIFLPGMEALKDREYPIGRMRVDADAVVTDRKDPVVPFSPD